MTSAASAVTPTLEAELVVTPAGSARRCVVERSHGETRLVLVDVQLPVEPEEVGVPAQEPADICVRREHVELLLLERAQVLRADLRRELRLREVETLAHARLAQAGSELEHQWSSR
jgi:hypothetical protein